MDTQEMSGAAEHKAVEDMTASDIRELLHSRGLGQTDLAAMAQMHPSDLSFVLRGAPIGPKRRARLAAALEIVRAEPMREVRVVERPILRVRKL